MKALRLKLFQETACYTKPFSKKVTETYPLPPYSTVKGMIHSLLNATEYIPFQLSIQGNHESILYDYKKTYSFKKSGFNMPLITDGLNIEFQDNRNMTAMPLNVHLLYNVELIIHIYAANDILDKILEAFQKMTKHLALGRAEDLVRIDDVRLVELSSFEVVELVASQYIPLEKFGDSDGVEGIPYLLNWTYEIKNNIREWQKINTLYVSKGSLLGESNLVQDVYSDENYLVIFNS